MHHDAKVIVRDDTSDTFEMENERIMHANLFLLGSPFDQMGKTITTKWLYLGLEAMIDALWWAYKYLQMHPNLIVKTARSFVT